MINVQTRFSRRQRPWMEKTLFSLFVSQSSHVERHFTRLSLDAVYSVTRILYIFLLLEIPREHVSRNLAIASCPINIYWRGSSFNTLNSSLRRRGEEEKAERKNNGGSEKSRDSPRGANLPQKITHGKRRTRVFFSSDAASCTYVRIYIYIYIYVYIYIYTLEEKVLAWLGKKRDSGEDDSSSSFN